MADDSDSNDLDLVKELLPEREATDSSVAPTDPDEKLATISSLIQGVWILVALFGFVDNVFGSAGASFPWHPTASAVALAWLAFGIVGAVINHLDNVGFAGAKMSFRKRERIVKAAVDESRDSVKALRGVLSDYSGLMQNWTNSVNLFDEQLAKYAKTDEDVEQILARYCMGRMEEARDTIAESGDEFRISFWWFDPSAGGLRLLFSPDIRDDATLAHIFKPGAGLCGQCFVEDRIYNIVDGPASIYYETIKTDPEYRGVLLVPVKPRNDEGVIGVLCVDRKKKEAFDENVSNLGCALAALIAYAMNAAIFVPTTEDDEAAAN